MIADEDSIVDEEEIDTNLSNIDDDDISSISKTYRSIDLKKWRPAPVVKENYGKPGEMGNLKIVFNNIIFYYVFYYFYLSFYKNIRKTCQNSIRSARTDERKIQRESVQLNGK